MNIEELKRLAEAATPGPWVLDELLADFYGFEVRTATDEKVCADASNEDAAYIAAANPAAVLELIRQRDELLAALKRIKANLMHQRLCGQSAGLLHAAIQAEGDAEEVIAKMDADHERI